MCSPCSIWNIFDLSYFNIWLRHSNDLYLGKENNENKVCSCVLHGIGTRSLTLH